MVWWGICWRSRSFILGNCRYLCLNSSCYHIPGHLCYVMLCCYGTWKMLFFFFISTHFSGWKRPLYVNTDRYAQRSATLYSDRTQVQILTLALFAYLICDISCDLLEPINRDYNIFMNIDTVNTKWDNTCKSNRPLPGSTHISSHSHKKKKIEE